MDGIWPVTEKGKKGKVKKEEGTNQLDWDWRWCISRG